MTRYILGPIKSAPDGDWNDPLLPSLSVTESVPVDTGLIARTGEPIMRLPEPLGFHRPGRALDKQETGQ